MDLTFQSYPGGRRHMARATRALPPAIHLGAGVEYVAHCGTRAVFWEHVLYQDRLSGREPNCKNCIMTKIEKEQD